MKRTTPLVRVVKIVPNNIERESSTGISSIIIKHPSKRLGGKYPTEKAVTPIKPQHSNATYRISITTSPSHLPASTCQRCTGLVTMAWMVCEVISPEIESTEAKIVSITVKK